MNKVFDEVSIVLVGSFNPAILHPSWFAREGLLPKSEADSANVNICMKEVTQFSLPWMFLEATNDRSVFRSSDSSHIDPLRDLAVGTFQLLQHTPVKQLGINRIIHFDMGSEELWHKVGDALAPKNLWNDFVKSPGLRNLAIEGVRPDEKQGNINITVQPVLNGQMRIVAVAFNDHYECPDFDGYSAATLIETQWNYSLQMSESISHDIIKAAVSADITGLAGRR